MKSKWKATMLLVATFAGGALAGGAAVGLAERRDPASRREHRHHGPDEHIAFLTKELKLTAAQRDSVQAILERYRPAMDSIWRQLGPRFETIKDSISNDIRRQLTPEQQKMYTELNRRVEAERRGSDSASDR